MNLTHSESVSRLHSIHARMSQLAKQDDLSAADQDEFDNLCTEFDEVNAHRERLERKHELARTGSGGGYKVVPGTGFEYNTDEREDDRALGGGLRSAAMRTLERHTKSGALPAPRR